MEDARKSTPLSLVRRTMVRSDRLRPMRPLLERLAENPRDDYFFASLLETLRRLDGKFYDSKVWRARFGLARDQGFLASAVTILGHGINKHDPVLVEAGLEILQGRGLVLGLEGVRDIANGFAWNTRRIRAGRRL